MHQRQIGITKVMDIWYYFANDWTSGLLDFRTSGLPDFRTSGLLDFRPPDFRTSGLPDFYIYLIFSVTMVRAARMMVVIQNLTVIFDSLNWRRGQWRKM